MPARTTTTRLGRLPAAVPESLLHALRSAWPPRALPDDRGYRPIPLAGTRPVDALSLPGADVPAALVVAQAPDDAFAVVPCVSEGPGWRLARAGDGLAAALVAGLGALRGGRVARGRFALERHGSLPVARGTELGLLADQSNLSIVVDETVLCKLRTASDAGGVRSLLLRRHLTAGGFDQTPPLLGSLTWQAPSGSPVCLADVDTWLPGARDGWDHYIDLLAGLMRDERDGAAPEARHVGAKLGRLTARLHLALATPSNLWAKPVRSATPDEIHAWLGQAEADMEAAAAIEAGDAESVAARLPDLRRDISGMAVVRGARVQPIHGDLHLGQLVRWQGGLAVIDFDGPPGTAPGATVELAPAERDVAQLLCSLDHLAAAVEQRTEGTHSERLQAWAMGAKADLLEAYRATTPDGAAPLDDRLLDGFVAQQLCRELLYAAARLPRWRYAPMQALRWRYPREDQA